MLLPATQRLLPSFLTLLVALATTPSFAQDRPVEITTDSPAYCLQLHDRVETLRTNATVPPPQEVTDLSAEGLRMCDNGLPRGGVTRLRRALAIMLHPDGEH